MIVPAQTHTATAHAVELAGAKPVELTSEHLLSQIIWLRFSLEPDDGFLCLDPQMVTLWMQCKEPCGPALAVEQLEGVR